MEQEEKNPLKSESETGDKIKEFIINKPYLFSLLIIGAVDFILSVVVIIFAITLGSTFLRWIGIILAIGIIAIYVCAYIFSRIANKPPKIE